MDWRNIISFGSYIIYLAALLEIGTGHPIHNHAKKLHQLETSKTHIGKHLTQVKTHNNAKKSSFLTGKFISNSASTEDAKKKGTIRISGPWHSESSLDRNVDPMEDSYVKKIISSNEGLNFNKDMAEAGEMFDVNGIEDFYDRNALITYEVNGHEIPVHLKQKLMPQSQTMFPEYGHDSQPSTDTTSRDGHTYSQRHPSGHKTTTFFGMSLKDLPEYKVQDTPSVNEKQHSFSQLSGRTRMSGPPYDQDDSYTRHNFAAKSSKPFPIDTNAFMHSFHQDGHGKTQSQVDGFASEYEQANEVGQEDDNFDHQLQNAHRADFESDFYKNQQPLGSDRSNAKMYQHLADAPDMLGREREPLDNSESGPAKDFPVLKGFGPQERPLQESSLFREHKNQALFPSPLHSEKFYQKRPSDSVQFSDSPKPFPSDKPAFEGSSRIHEIKAFYYKPTPSDKGSQGDIRGVGKDFDGDKLVPAVAEGEKSRLDDKADDSKSFFEQLEKIDEERKWNERKQPKLLPEVNTSLPDIAESIQRYTGDGERTKAKDKLLKILGDLTSKLKGMEAAVKDTHTDERRESPLDSNLENVQQKETEQKLEGKNNDGDIHPFVQTQEEASHETSKDSEGKMYNGKDGVDSTHQFPWEASEYAHADSVSHETPKSDSYPSYDHNPSESEGEEANQKQVSHAISNLKQHGRPFIFNTEDIDYKGPSYEEKTSSSRVKGDEEKYYMNSHSNDHGEDLPQQPIVSSFYHGMNRNSEFDLHAYHPESASSIGNEVMPTQREVGKSYHAEKEMLKGKEEDELQKKPVEHNGDKAKQIKENNLDADDDLPDYNEVKDAAVFEENFIRKKYHSPSLHWSDDLSDDAQKEADNLAEEKLLDLNKKNTPSGMNIALLPLNSLNVGKDSADLWKKEAAKFDFVSPIISKKNSNFAQMVWKTAKEFGLGVAKSRDKENWIVVAKYDTPAVSEYEKLKTNIESDIPLTDPYSDIARRGKIIKARKSVY